METDEGSQSVTNGNCRTVLIRRTKNASLFHVHLRVKPPDTRIRHQSFGCNDSSEERRGEERREASYLSYLKSVECTYIVAQFCCTYGVRKNVLIDLSRGRGKFKKSSTKICCGNM
ncbi:hypothetical protein LENED_000053 [Lentinula edodes]|uniref:Uncharacterized protein n=1 Tax=Lentinula edodes TaxID=5353 RepID=A0A1Q3DUW0_LENED|nr:hypothetical protein LENED_000053 [Lentinula edodes]